MHRTRSASTGAPRTALVLHSEQCSQGPPRHGRQYALAAVRASAGCSVSAHHVAVAVLDAADDLLEKVPRLILQEATLLDNVVKELARLPRYSFALHMVSCIVGPGTLTSGFDRAYVRTKQAFTLCRACLLM